MKKNFAALLIIIAWTFMQAQNYTHALLSKKEKTVLRQDLNRYIDASVNKDIDGILDGIYPGLYKLTSREDMRKTLDNAFHDQTVDVYFNKPETVKIYDSILTKNQKKYVLIYYESIETFVFHPRNKEKENPEAFQGRMRYTLHKMKQIYGDQYVRQGSEDNIIHITKPKYMLAIWVPEKKRYTFIDFSTDYKHMQMLEQLFDKEILDFFGNMIER